MRQGIYRPETWHCSVTSFRELKDPPSILKDYEGFDSPWMNFEQTRLLEVELVRGIAGCKVVDSFGNCYDIFIFLFTLLAYIQ